MSDTRLTSTLGRIQRLDAQNPLRRLVDDIDSVTPGGQVLIFCGEASNAVYGSEPFIRAIHGANKKDADIRIITSPILLVDDADRRHGLLELRAANAIRFLGHRLSRDKSPHFRVITQAGGRHLLRAEVPHRPLEAGPHEINVEQISGDPEGLARGYIHEFEAWEEAIEGRTCERNAQVPILLTQDEVKKLELHVDQSGRVLDFLDADQLRQLLSELGIDLSER